MLRSAYKGLKLLDFLITQDIVLMFYSYNCIGCWYMLSTVMSIPLVLNEMHTLFCGCRLAVEQFVI
jgi:hypothetical protein